MREPPSSPGDGRKPGQSATPCGPGASRRPYRHPIPGGAAGSERTQRSRGVATASESKAATAPAWRRQVRSSHARAGALRPAPDLPSCRTRISPATSRVLLGAAWEERVRQAHRRHRAAVGLARGEERRSGDGPAGPASLIEHISRPASRPVWTALLGRTTAAARRRRVLVHQVQLERAGFRSDRASLPSKRSPAT